MLLVMTAFFALGRRRSRDLFLISLLALSAVISFRFQRENWLVLAAAVAIIGNAMAAATTAAAEPAQKLRLQKRSHGNTRVSGYASCLCCAFPASRRLCSSGERVSCSKIAQNLPHRLRQTTFARTISRSRSSTAYAWGAFLTWALPDYPVLIDGRADLYGDAINLPYFQATTGATPLRILCRLYPGADAPPRKQTLPMAQALSTLPGFRVAYKDDVAVVLVRNE